VIAAGAVIFGVLCWNNAAMAAMLLGGGPNLSHGEVFGAMATAVSAGVTTALVASGIGTALGAAGLGGGAAASSAGVTTAIGASAPTSGAMPAVRPAAAMQSAAYAGSTVAGVLSSMNHGSGYSVSPPSFRGFGE
jgi:hypothetical protein